MRKMPPVLFIFSVLMMLIAVGMPFQAIYIQGFENVFRSLTWMNIVVVLLCAATSIAAYQAHKITRYLLAVTALCVLFNNWWVGTVGLNYSMWHTSIASLGFILFCATLLERNAFRVLANPKLKWWHIPARSKIEVPVSLSPNVRGEPILKKSFDISETGFFMQGLNEKELDLLKVGEKFTVCFYFDKLLKIRCNAKVVRKTVEQKGAYPSGIGLQFDEIDEHAREVLRRLSRPSSEYLIN